MKSGVRQTALRALAAGIAALTLAACGSTTGGASSSGATESGASSASAGGSSAPKSAGTAGATSGGASASSTAPIVVAAPAPYTGAEGAFGTYVDDAFAAAMVKYGDNVNGRKIQLEKGDTKCTPSTAVQAISQLLTKNPLVATSSECSGDNLAMKPKISAAGVPMVVDSLSPNVIDGADTMWQVTSTVDPIGAGLDRYMASHGATTVAVMHDASAYGVAAAKGVTDAAAKSKLNIVKDVTYQLTDTDYSAGILAIKAANPSAVYIEGYAVQQAQVITQMKQLGLTMPIYASMDIDDPAAFKAGGSALNGVIFASSWIANDSPASKEFVENYTKVANTAPAVVAETAYESAVVILEALKNTSGDLTPQAVNKAIGAISVELPSGPATFGSDRIRKGANIYVGEVEDGAIKSLGTA